MEVMPVSDIFYSNIIMKLIMKLYPNVCTLKTMALLVSLENHLQKSFYPRTMHARYLIS